ncbi:hypothetical protein [Flavobacterium sp. WC2416]|uniref:Uncharacterized protein n=1 Tax=Flavobacterium sp. WC2416 TaxID=3234141 RepID=A0AB39WA94_9FLAO
MNTRILLSENNAAAESLINQKQLGYKNGVQLLAGLAKLGLELESVNNWETDVLPHFKTDFPNSTLDFNLDSRGIKDEFKALEVFYNKNRGSLSFVAPTAEELEAIREKYRVYATVKQAEALEVVERVANDLNKLKSEFGFNLNFGYVSQLFYPLRQTADYKVEVSQEGLLSYLKKLE